MNCRLQGEGDEEDNQSGRGRCTDLRRRQPDDRGLHGRGHAARLIDEMVRQGKKDLTIIANDTARPGVGIGKLIDAKLVRRVITSHIGTNPETQRQMLAGEIEVELVPQGTLAERIRAGGYGLGGVLTPTGTMFWASARTTPAAMAIRGLKFRAVSA